jgi:hypothetical protein
MKTGYWLVLGIVSASAMQGVACSSSFTSCQDTLTCVSSSGAGGNAGGSSADGGAGDTSDSAGVRNDPTGGVGNTAGTDSGGTRGSDEDSGGAGEAGANGGAIDCDADLEACNGTCVDRDKDPKNCGACGHDCLGGACTLGVCQAIEMAANQGSLMILALDDQFIYWGGELAIIGKKRIDNSGMSTVLVPAGEVAYSGVLVGQTLYWANDFRDSGVRGCMLPDCAGGPSLLVSAAAPPESVAYSASTSTLYWTQATSIWHKVLPSGTATQFVATTNRPFELVSDDLFLYWSEYNATTKTTEIRKENLTGGSSSSLATGLTSVDGIVPYGKKLYGVFGGEGAQSIGTIALPTGIGSASPALFAPVATTFSLAVDESGVYWEQRDDASNGSIRHCPLAGCSGDPEILAPTTKPWAIKTDSKAIYWVTTDGSVMKLAK